MVVIPGKKLLQIEAWFRDVWRDAESLDPNMQNDKLATNNYWFVPHLQAATATATASDVGNSPVPPPPYYGEHKLP